MSPLFSTFKRSWFPILLLLFKNPNIKWPKLYEKRGAFRVRNVDDILEHLLNIQVLGQDNLWENFGT